MRHNYSSLIFSLSASFDIPPPSLRSLVWILSLGNHDIDLTSLSFNSLPSLPISLLSALSSLSWETHRGSGGWEKSRYQFYLPLAHPPVVVGAPHDPLGGWSRGIGERK